MLPIHSSPHATGVQIAQASARDVPEESVAIFQLIRARKAALVDVVQLKKETYLEPPLSRVRSRRFVDHRKWQKAESLERYSGKRYFLKNSNYSVHQTKIKVEHLLKEGVKDDFENPQKMHPIVQKAGWRKHFSIRS